MDDAARSGWPARIAGVLVPAAAVLVVMATSALVPRADLRFTTPAGASPAALVADSLASMGLVVAILAAWVMQPRDRGLREVVGVLAIAWVAPNWIGWDGAPDLARSVGLLVAPLFVPAFAHLVARRLGRPVPTTGLVATYAVAGGLVVARLVVYDPFLDLSCWSMCRGNVWLVGARPEVARALSTTWTAVTALVGVATVLACGRWLVGSRGVARRTLLPVVVPVAVIGLVLVFRSAVLLARPDVEPLDPALVTTHVVLALGTVALAIGLTAASVRAQRVRLAIATLATDLAGASLPRPLAEVLAHVTGDAALRVLYPLPEEGIHIDAEGRPVDLTRREPGRVVTLIMRDGQEVAAVSHGVVTGDPTGWQGQVGSAARLAVDNERLQARLHLQLRRLRDSRSRLVAAGDDERRRLERNLHDGAQQSLLALLRETHGALRAVRAAGNDDLAARLEAAVSAASAALGELRVVANGIHPVVADDAGVVAALQSLAERAPLVVDLRAEIRPRLPPVVTATIVVVATEAVEGARRRGGEHLALTLLERDDRIVVEARGAGGGSFVHLADRVSALGGQFHATEHLLRAEFPCASSSPKT